MPSSPPEPLLRIRGARQNNLVGVDVDLPRGALVAITGVSGSGKSSLAFDTLFREGQRRFLETLSAYARQFLGDMQKPEVESIEGLSPAIAVDQKTIARGSRSTVGTLTEIVDHLRVLYARAGQAHCPSCDRPIQSRTPEAVVQEILREHAGKKVQVLAPLIRDRKGQHKALMEDLRKKGYVRARVDGEVVRLEEAPELERYKRHSIEVVVDRLKPDAAEPARLREAVEAALGLSDGDLVILTDGGAQPYSTLRTCPGCGEETPPLEPRLFSFNSPHGACEHCSGLGVLRRPSEAAVVKDPELSIRDGALAVTRAKGGGISFPRASWDFLERVGEACGFDLDTPWNELSRAGRQVVLYGAGDQRFQDTHSWNGQRFKGTADWMRHYHGVLPALQRAWNKGSRRKQLERYLSEGPCPACDGTRLRSAARAVRLGDARLTELSARPVHELGPALKSIQLDRRQKRIARDLLSEIERRVDFLLRVGLGYLTLDRGADTLSGGEAQRIRLAAQLGAGLQGVLYVLDEPSIGLHATDHERLLGALAHLRDAGNSVVVVEHDEATLRSADWIVDVGPQAGAGGGNIVAQGPPAEVAKAQTPTGRLLRGEIAIPAPETRRQGEQELVVRDARAFNLKGIDAHFPLGTLTLVTGVSGSGKSTLVERTLRRALTRHLGRETPDPGEHRKIEGLEHIDEMVAIDASPIGRTPRSNPATYTKVLGPIRDLFAQLPEAKVRGYTKSRFSFNIEGGRCEACLGAGAKHVELQFLAAVTVPCEECGGHRFQAETLDVKFKGHSIADVLALPASQALELFEDHPRIRRPLELMVEVGLGYLTLGQPSTTISGGEAQRLKLVTHLSKRPSGHTLYILDEPTTGLHLADVERLALALQKLVDLGHTVIVVEHNLELIQAADWVLDLGPEGGSGGGELLVAGTPEDVARCKASRTGRALRELNAARGNLSKGRPLSSEATECTDLTVTGARTHNLTGVDVSIPRGSLTVVTGPSGSGKSSLALDTIFTEGRRRFVESLSTYARQFLGTKDKPPVERIEGLGPSVAVEARTVGSHPRSTVATTTEIHDYLRVLWARAGTAYCPDHGEKLEKGDPGRITRKVLKATDGQNAKGWILAPVFGHGLKVPEDVPSEVERRVEAWRAAGFARIYVDGAELRLDEEPKQRAKVLESASSVDLVIDRVSFAASARARIAEAVEQASNIAHGRVSIQLRGGDRLEYSLSGACTQCGFQLDTELEPRHFSFNAHVGACPDCDGLGERVQCDADKLIADDWAPLTDGAISGKLGRYLTKGKGFYENLLRTVAKSHRINLDKPYRKMTQRQKDILMYGKGAKDEYTVTMERNTSNANVHEEFTASWPGLCGQIDVWHQRTDDPEWAKILETVMVKSTCSTCEGERLGRGYRFVSVGRKRLPEVLRMSVEDGLAWLGALRLKADVRQAVEPVLEELRSRVGLLERVGLGYVTLERPTETLSGGEARRVRLSASLGSQLVGVCYVLDEPTVGLHPRDIDRLTEALCGLRDAGNTVLVVEHDAALMRQADFLVDMGPGAGTRGGQVVVAGTPDEVRAHPTSGTGAYLRGEILLQEVLDEDARADDVSEPVSEAELDSDEYLDSDDEWNQLIAGVPLTEIDPSLEEVASGPRAKDSEGEEFGIEYGDMGEPQEQPSNGRPRLLLKGAKVNNLKGIDFEARYGEITGICGPSGSGKSTLILETLVPAMQGEPERGRWTKFQDQGVASGRLVVIDSSPIGRTPHSVPATYAGLMLPLRELFVRTPEARMRGYDVAHFSFNSNKGRCQACDGRGSVLVEMQFLADLWLTCEECDGKRYAPQILEVRFRGKTIADVLEMEVDEAFEFLEHQPKQRAVLKTLQDVGLGYLRLGQSSTTLSGGEAQRLKLAAELMRAQSGERNVLVLDEPSTGLSATDTVHLARVLGRLARRGHAVLLIEHHTELLAIADRLVELGPEGGALGGRIIARGTPHELIENPASVTGPWLAQDVLEPAPSPRSKKRARKRRSSTAS